MSNVGKQAAATLFALIGFCILFVNIFGGLVAGIWLLAKGQWAIVVLGFLMGFLMPTAWTILSLPAMGFAAVLCRKGNAPSRQSMAAGGFIIALWNACLVSMWCASIFFLFSGRIVDGTAIPLLLWAYSTTMAPLAYMASKESEASTGTAFSMLLALVTYVVLLITYLANCEKSTAMMTVIIFALVQAILVTAYGVAVTPSRPSDY